MGIQNKKIKELAERYKAGLCTAEELKQIKQWYDEFETNGYTLPTENEIDKASYEAALAAIMRIAKNQDRPLTATDHPEIQPPEHYQALCTPSNRKSTYSILYAVAAVLLFVTAIGSCFYLLTRKPPVFLTHMAKRNFVPGGNKAVLTLSNGSNIILNNKQKGHFAQQNYTAIHKTNNGLLTYVATRPTDKSHESKVNEVNTITTPRGGQYQVILPDGSHVWLNSVSSIRFPVAFTGNDRRVEITGEVYFEVAKDKHKPFHVISAGQTVTVLGTHFNIMTYPEEKNVVTTLLEGSVLIIKGKNSKILKPGEQALADEDLTVVTADTDDAIAWKNGVTSFAEADIKTIMRKISRWYDIDVEYQGSVSNRLFNGAISRKSDLSELLKILTLNHIQFSIERNKLIVKQ